MNMLTEKGGAKRQPKTVVELNDEIEKLLTIKEMQQYRKNEAILFSRMQGEHTDTRKKNIRDKLIDLSKLLLKIKLTESSNGNEPDLYLFTAIIIPKLHEVGLLNEFLKTLTRENQNILLEEMRKAEKDGYLDPLSIQIAIIVLQAACTTGEDYMTPFNLLIEETALENAIHALKINERQELDSHLVSQKSNESPSRVIAYLLVRLIMLPDPENTLNPALTTKVDEPGYRIGTFESSKSQINLFDYLKSLLEELKIKEVRNDHPTLVKVAKLIQHFENEDTSKFESLLQEQQNDNSLLHFDTTSWKIYQAAVKSSSGKTSPTASNSTGSDTY
jgi:hypothetical protein